MKDDEASARHEPSAFQLRTLAAVADRRRCCADLVRVLAMLVLTSLARAADAPAAPVKHVFIVVLETEAYRVTFGQDSPAPYLARTLPSQAR